MITLDLHKSLSGPRGPFSLDISVEIESGSFVCIYGKSGAGKTTLLRLIAGLVIPDNGNIKVKDNTWYNSSAKVNLSPQKRDAGIVFQEYALFPHMTVRQNLTYALPKNSDSKIVDQLIEISELGDLQNVRPNTLSGGQQQRVALARAVVQRPGVLLLDEPLSALDSEIRYKLQKYLYTLHQEFNLTTFMVSHDVSEILRLANMAICLEAGKVTKMGPPTETFRHQEVSGKFQFSGQVISISKHDVIFVIEVLIANDLVKIVADKNEAELLSIGDHVIVASKAFNPIIKKIN